MQIEYISVSPSCTFEAGKKLSRFLMGGDILLFSGELGGGKTTFISGIAVGLKITENVSSPSFTIINEYRGKRTKLIHVDLYRLDSLEEFENTGIDDYIYNSEYIVCIEWGEKMEKNIKKDCLLLDFRYILDGGGAKKRKIILKVNSRLWEKRLKRFKDLLKG